MASGLRLPVRGKAVARCGACNVIEQLWWRFPVGGDSVYYVVRIRYGGHHICRSLSWRPSMNHVSDWWGFQCGKELEPWSRTSSTAFSPPIIFLLSFSTTICCRGFDQYDLEYLDHWLKFLMQRKFHHYCMTMPSSTWRPMPLSVMWCLFLLHSVGNVVEPCVS